MVKQVVTESSKQKMLIDYNKKKKQLEKEISQLEFQLHKKLKTSKNDYEYQNLLKSSFLKEIKERNDKVKMILFQIQQINDLELGSEVNDHVVESIVNIEIGDKWDEILNSEIVLKDGVVHEIRKGGNKSG